MGRPTSDESRLEAYADKARHPAMRLLARRAARAGRTLERLAAAIKRDPRALADTLSRKKPRVESVRSLVTELVPDLLSPAVVVARALLDELDDEDQRLARRQLDDELRRRSHTAIHPELMEPFATIRSQLAAVTPERRRKALTDFILAFNRLNEDGQDAIVAIASALGVELPLVDVLAEMQRRYESYAALLWLLKATSLPLQTQSDIADLLVEPRHDTLRKILRAKDEPDALDADLSAGERETLADALNAARSTFLDCIRAIKPRRPSTPITVDPIKLEYLRKEPTP